MIIRVFRVQVHDGKQEEFREFFINTALPFVKSHQGLISASIGVPGSMNPNEFLMVMEWENLDALEGFAGKEWHQAVIHPDEVHLIRKVHVHHYESTDAPT